jgi:Transglycosylase SLT domain
MRNAQIGAIAALALTGLLAADTVASSGGLARASAYSRQTLAAAGASARASRRAAASPSASPRSMAPAPPEPVQLGPAPRRLLVPELAAVLPAGASDAAVAAVSKLAGVRAVLAADGGEIHVNGRPAATLGVVPAEFRAWSPPATAADPRVWAALLAGRMVSTQDAATRLGLATGTAYPVQGSVKTTVPFGRKSLLGISGIDLVVNSTRSAQLGLIPRAVLLVNAPGADLTALSGRIRHMLGMGARVVTLVQVTTTTVLPVDAHVPGGRPSNYLQLFQESAARYCPGLSWTVLAAIGQIESGDGQNNGPSTAGALGPMQFMPGTWAVWGTDGFGQSGKPDVWNPFDAVPSAARMLCADGAARGGTSLAAAIFDYNHAGWYVAEVLELAGEYAREYR